MITAEVQIHGYRKGHQLLASSAILSKDDQAVIDRLSDVAGPLRPKEQFPPYLSAYPLPSGSYYVIARTWQDHTVSRAGCVRTMSVLIDAQIWSLKPPLLPILRLLSSAELPDEQDAARIELEETFEQCLPSPSPFSAGELLEALFLEDAKPVVVFDAPDPELIALRLLAALWPDMRRRFALSTFALSPRKIGGRDLDLVFAPMTAKAKFSDWPGRRVDGRSLQNDRHRWTRALVRRVFEDPLPKLLSDREINLLGGSDADSAAALRIALLWDELLEKVHQTPTAVLGLLDIANSGMVSNAVAVRVLEPLLAEAAHRAASTLPANDAWEFVGAIARKIQGHYMQPSRGVVEQLAKQLAVQSPNGAIKILSQPDPKGIITALIPSIAAGLGQGSDAYVEQALLNAPMDILARLVAQSGELAGRVAQDDGLLKRMEKVLTEVDRELADGAGKMLLPFLIDDRQLVAAKPIIRRLDLQAVVAELNWLGQANGFKAKRLCSMLIEQARRARGLPLIRDALMSSEASLQRDSLLSQSIDPIGTDVLWLMGEKRLSKTLSTRMLLSVLERADSEQFAELLSASTIVERVLDLPPEDSADVLVRMALQDSLPMNTQSRVISSVIPRISDALKFEVAERVIGRCLRNRFDGDESDILPMLFSILGARLDGRWLASAGLGRSIDMEVARRNLIVYEKAPPAVRQRIVGAVDEIAFALQTRHGIDLDEASSEACAKLMLDAEKASRRILLTAAGLLMPLLLRARHQPVSLLIAALYPVLYRELASSDDVPDLLKFIPFLDWDRCKTARRELVDSFMSSSWKAGDLALTAHRCSDVARILEQVAKSYGGEKYLALIEDDLGRLDDNDRRMVERKISDIRSDRGY